MTFFAAFPSADPMSFLSRSQFSNLSAHASSPKVWPTKAARSYSDLGLSGSMLSLLSSNRLAIYNQDIEF